MKLKYRVGQKIRFDTKSFGHMDYLPPGLQKYLRGTMTITKINCVSDFNGYEVVVDYQGGINIPTKWILPNNEDSTEYED